MRGTWVCFHKCMYGREETWKPDNVGCGKRKGEGPLGEPSPQKHDMLDEKETHINSSVHISQSDITPDLFLDLFRTNFSFETNLLNDDIPEA